MRLGSTPLIVRTLITGVLLSTAASAQLTGGQTTLNPFEPTTRWSIDAPLAKPWIPRSVDFAVQGELLWSAPSVANPSLLLSSTAGDGSEGPLFEDQTLAGAIGPVLVCAGDEIDELFSAAQYPEGGSRCTTVMGHDPRTSAIDGTPFAPKWTYDPGVATDRPSLLDCGPSAEFLVCATFEGGEIQVDWLDPADGTRNSRVSITGSGLTAMAISEATERVALIAGLDLWLIDRAGTVLVHEQLFTNTKALALSEDGAILAYGDFGVIYVLSEYAGNYVNQGSFYGEVSELPTRIALSGNGTRLAVGWWDFVTGADVRLEVLDVASGQSLVLREQDGQVGGVQNFPEAVLLSPDGTRAAFGLWGLADDQPELYLIDVATDTDLIAENLLGSVQALAIDASGTRLALGIKNGHANDFGTTGSVMLLDSGEREIQLTSAPERGGYLSMATFFPGQIYTLLVIGYESAQGGVAGAWNGLAYLDPSKNFLRRGTLPDGNGFSALDINIPDQPNLVGVSFGIQAIFLTGYEITMSNAVLRPTIF